MKVKLLSFVTIEPITILFKVGSWDEWDGMLGRVVAWVGRMNWE